MKKIDLTIVADVAFYGVSAWFLSIGILRYFRMQFPLAALLSALFSLAAGGTAFLLTSRSRRKRRLNKKETEERDALLLHFALEKEERVRAALLTAFLADQQQAHLKDDVLVVDGNLCIPRFTMQPLSADEIARLIRAYGAEKTTVLCNVLSAEAQKLAATFGVKIIGKDEIYSLFQRTDSTPSPLILAEIPRKNAKKVFRRLVAKKSARPFFVSGILLLIMSLFTFFPIYYLIAGCILTSLSILIRFFGFASETS